MELFLLSRGSQQVSNEGDVIYVFPKDYRAKLLGKSFVMRVEPLLEKAKVLSNVLVEFDNFFIAFDFCLEIGTNMMRFERPWLSI